MPDVMTEPPVFLKVDECAALYGVSRATLYALLMSGELPSVKIGRLRRVRRSDALTYAAQLPASLVESGPGRS